MRWRLSPSSPLRLIQVLAAAFPFAAALLFAAANPAVLAAPAATTAAPVRIILVGDSTMAPHNGYGSGLIALSNSANTVCFNLAHNGRSSKSYRAEGSWAKVQELLAYPAGFSATYVLIQFGHNDQPNKGARSTDLRTEFPENMRRYARETKAAGGIPVLVTPLTRRIFRHGILESDLAPWAAATRLVAREEGVAVLDLNSESAAAVQAMGPAEANTLAVAPPPHEVVAAALRGESPPVKKTAATAAADNASVEVVGPSARTFDYTHLGPKGAAFFGAMVARELVRAEPALSAHFRLPQEP